jgi:hypothetical protein
MSGQTSSEREAYLIGHEDGSELAAALVLASDLGRAERALTRRMAQIVLDQIENKVRRLASTRLAPNLIQNYERGARHGVRDELFRSGVPQPVTRPCSRGFLLPIGVHQ